MNFYLHYVNCFACAETVASIFLSKNAMDYLMYSLIKNYNFPFSKNSISIPNNFCFFPCDTVI